jgi:hypothetical protein
MMTGIDSEGRILCSSGGSIENAFAVGETELNDISSSNNWGWQLAVKKGETLTRPIYAGARQNDLAKGKKAGTLTVSYTGRSVSAKFRMDAGFSMSETHLYAGKGNVPTTKPDRYGHSHQGLKNVVVDSYQITVSGKDASLNVVAHAKVSSKN